jgi:transcriptional regulator with XRE-family HTH domain
MKLERLKEWRESRGMTQKELAAEARASEYTIARAEAGATVRPNTARRLAEGIGVAVADLLESPPTPAGKVSAPTGAGRTEGTPASPKDSGLPEWAQAPDLEAFGRKISRLPTLELRNFAVELVSGQRTRLLEDLRERPLSREEAAERAANFARELIVRDELSLRDEELPEEFVLGFRRAFNALTPPAEAKTHSHEAEPGREAS